MQIENIKWIILIINLILITKTTVVGEFTLIIFLLYPWIYLHLTNSKFDITWFPSYQFWVVLFLAGILTGISVFKEIKYNPYKTTCSEERCPTFRMIQLRLRHWIFSILTGIFIFLFDKRFDAMYIVILLFLGFTWLIYGDCIYSILERSEYDVIPQNMRRRHPYWMTLFKDSKNYDLLYKLIHFIQIISLIVIFSRSGNIMKIVTISIISIFSIGYKKKIQELLE